MTSNGRVDIIIARLDRIESKLDDYRREAAEGIGVVHSRVNKTNENVADVKSRVARVEVIGGMLQTVWGALIGWLFQGR